MTSLSKTNLATSRDSKQAYAIMVDLDHTVLQHLCHTGVGNAYAEMNQFLANKGFVRLQGNIYFGEPTANAVSCVLITQQLGRKFDWFVPALKDIRMLRIEDNTDLMLALIDVCDHD